MKKHIISLQQFLKTKLGMVFGVVVVIALGYGIFGGSKADTNLIKVTRGSISQEVSITGKTKAVNNVTLAFERGGRIAHVNKNVGDTVYEGETIVSLEASELIAQLAQAEASRDAAQAKFDEVRRGDRPEDIQVKRTELAKAQQELTNDYNNIIDVINSSYVSADDAIRKQIDDLFINDENSNVQLSFTVSDSQKQINAESQRSRASFELNAWKAEIGKIQAGNNASLDASLSTTADHLIVIRSFLSTLMDAALSATSVSGTTLNTYRASITTARTNVNTALTNINSQIQTIASQKIAVQKITDELNLKLSGNDPQEVAAQAANLKQAEASVSLVRAQLSKTSIRSPFSGVVTVQDAKVGEIVGANTPITSVISLQKLQIESNIPEVDISKVAVGNPVRITLDAFPGETFAGSVVHIDPAETVVDGVVNFKVEILFDEKEKDRGVKSGLTANLAIETSKKSDVLLLPQYALLEKDNGVFVRLSSNGIVIETPVTIGIRSQDGNVEIISGVREGDTVENIGIKK